MDERRTLDGLQSTRRDQAARPAVGISLVLPAYNEAEMIEQAIVEADEALGALSDNYEIIVVDDGSRDATAALAEAQAKTRSSVKVLRQPRNLGYGAALRRGFQAATMPLVAFTDADCQFDLREMDRLTLLARHYDIVCGYRIDRQDPWPRKLYSKTYNLIVRTLLGTGVRDCDCAFKVFRREVVESLAIETNGFFVNAEILSKARQEGKSIVEVGVTHRPRPRGKSTVSPLHALPVAATLVRFWWNAILFPPAAHADAPAENRWSINYQLGAVAVLVLACLLLLVPNLSSALMEPDETRYAQIPLEMIRSGDWITPTLHGEPYLDKPPLVYWMTALCYKLVGVNETAARLPCVLACVFTVLSMYGMGRLIVGDRAAWYGALAILTSWGFVLTGRFLVLDGPLTLFTTVAILSAYLAMCRPQLHLGWWLVSATACALGVLTKGPIAIVILLPPLLAWRWLAASSVRIQLRHWLAFAMPAVILCAPWFWAVSASHGEYMGYFFWKHNVLRFFSTFTHREPWWYYLPVFVVGMFPASLPLYPLAIFLFGRSSVDRHLRNNAHGYLLLSVAWILGFFSISSCKLPTYILPAAPPFCLLVGSVLAALAISTRRVSLVDKIVFAIPKILLAMAAVAAVAVATIDLTFSPEPAIGTMLDAAVVAVGLATVLLIWRIQFTSKKVAWACCWTLLVMTLTFSYGDFLPEIAQLRSIHAHALQIHQLHPSAPVVYVADNSNTASFHLSAQELVELRSDQMSELKSLVTTHGEAVVVMKPTMATQIQHDESPSIQCESQGGRGHVYLLSARPSSSQHARTARSPSVKR